MVRPRVDRAAENRCCACNALVAVDSWQIMLFWAFWSFGKASCNNGCGCGECEDCLNGKNNGQVVSVNGSGLGCEEV